MQMFKVLKGWTEGRVQKPIGGLCDIEWVKLSAAEHILDQKDGGRLLDTQAPSANTLY